MKKTDGLHQDFAQNNLNFDLGYRDKDRKNYDKNNLNYKPKFGEVNIKKKK